MDHTHVTRTDSKKETMNSSPTVALLPASAVNPALQLQGLESSILKITEMESWVL